MTKTPVRLEDLFKYYKHGTPHQMAAIVELEDALLKVAPDILNRDQPWFKTWSQSGKQRDDSKVLSIPYQSQRDNYRDAWRTCFSTSCAMLVMTLKPGIIKSDDDYIQEVFKRGDSTDALVQIATLKHFDISASFRSNGNRDLIKKQIDNGIPVPCGFLHHGTIDKPTGGGHWLIVTGYDKLGYWVNDPWGEIDLNSGNYISTNGKNLHYSFNGWEPRWMPDGPNSGWCIIA